MAVNRMNEREPPNSLNENLEIKYLISFMPQFYF